MRVAYITGKRGDVALGKEASKLGDSNKARTRIDSVELVGYRVVPDKSKNNSSTHKQATMTPRQAGFFCLAASRLYGNAPPEERLGRSPLQRAMFVFALPDSQP
jgi:hypothetical protein